MKSTKTEVNFVLVSTHTAAFSASPSRSLCAAADGAVLLYFGNNVLLNLTGIFNFSCYWPSREFHCYYCNGFFPKYLSSIFVFLTVDIGRWTVDSIIPCSSWVFAVQVPPCPPGFIHTVTPSVPHSLDDVMPWLFQQHSSAVLMPSFSSGQPWWLLGQLSPEAALRNTTPRLWPTVLLNWV